MFSGVFKVGNFIKKQTLAQVFFCEFCGNTFFIEHLRAAVSENPLLVDEAHLCISDSETETKKFSPILGCHYCRR